MVRSVVPGLFLVHYQGWSNRFDEWVPTENVKPGKRSAKVRIIVLVCCAIAHINRALNWTQILGASWLLTFKIPKGIN